MSRGLGRRQRDILARLADHHELNHYTNRPPQWVTVRELAGLHAADPYWHHASQVEATRRAVRGLEAAGLVETRLIHRDDRNQPQLGVRLPE